MTIRIRLESGSADDHTAHENDFELQLVDRDTLTVERAWLCRRVDVELDPAIVEALFGGREALRAAIERAIESEAA